MCEVGPDTFKKGHGENYCVFAGDQMVLLKGSGALEQTHIVLAILQRQILLSCNHVTENGVHFF